MQRAQTKKITTVPKMINKIKGPKKPTLDLKLNEDMVDKLKTTIFLSVITQYKSLGKRNKRSL